MKKSLLLAATSLLFCGCASTGTHDGMVYRDGSWYAPASEGHGDYYTAVQHSHYAAYDYPYDFGIGLLPYGGYCPVQYRWCTSYWPYYDPYWYQPWAYYQPRPRHPRQRVVDAPGQAPDDDTLPLPGNGEARQRPRQRPDSWPQRPAQAPRARGGGEGRRRGESGGGAGEGG